MNNPSKILCCVDSSSIFKRCVTITGWAFCPDTVISQMILSFPNGRIYILGTPNLDSPDVAAVRGPKASHCRFDEQVLISEPNEDILNAELIIRASNGASHVEKLHCQLTNAFDIATMQDLAEDEYFKMIDSMHHRFINRDEPYHTVFRDFISLSMQVSSPSILEIGSRNVSGVTRRDLFPHCGDYVGFDVLAGEGVDVVGDAHQLAKFFPMEHFDFIYSISVFEHLLCPWKVVLEMNTVMKLGGYVFVSTHPVWPEHEVPWDFWRFPGNGFHSLFNQYTGFR